MPKLMKNIPFSLNVHTLSDEVNMNALLSTDKIYNLGGDGIRERIIPFFP